jgi:hypothetical protein
MLFTSPYSPEQWAEARRLRAEGASFAAIGKALGMVGPTISSRARREAWPRPPGATAPAARKPSTASVRGQPSTLPADADEARGILIHRVYALSDLNLQLTELRMRKQLKIAKRIAKADDDELPPAPREEDKQQVTDTVKTLEQTKELHTGLKRSAGGGARPGGAEGGASETAAFHREIAERLGKVVPPS